jgi:hypothetical protein
MLTIISVSYNSKPYLELNYRLVKALNPDTPFEWIVVQNTPADKLADDLAMDDPRFTMVPGAHMTAEEANNISYGSYHHVKGLHIGLYYATSPHVLVLDPDCFMLRPNWINRVQDYVNEQGLCFWGTPYHPDRFYNYRDFPTAIGMWINRGLLQSQYHQYELNFYPVTNHWFFSKVFYWAIQRQINDFNNLKCFFNGRNREHPLSRNRHAYWVVREFVRRRVPQLLVGTVKDTGYQVFKAFYKKVPSAVMAVAFKDLRTPKVKQIEAFLPDRLRLIPKRVKYLQAVGPLDEAIRQDFPTSEQFYWQGELFALHLGKVSYSVANPQAQQRIFDRISQLAGLGVETTSTAAISLA